MKTKTKNGADFEIEKFVVVWQKAADMDEVVRSFAGYDRHLLRQKATQLRRNGVPLKKFRRRYVHRYDHKALAALARKYEPK